MAGDSIREELADKIIITSKSKFISNRRTTKAVQKTSSQFKLNPPPSPIITKPAFRTETSEIHSKKTNRTLVEFQSKDGTVPEWRTQVKNAVRQRMVQRSPESDDIQDSSNKVIRKYRTQDDNFFDGAEILIEERSTATANDLLANALKRINSSRQMYHVTGSSSGTATATAMAPARSLESAPVSKIEPRESEKTSLNFLPAPAYSPNVDLYDTSDLDPEFLPAKVSSSFGKVTLRKTAAPDAEEIVEVETKTEKTLPENETAGISDVEIQKAELQDEDNAPFAFRFNAGLFDILTASFASLVLLAPFMLLGGNWFTVAGVFAFFATSSIVTFIYLTTTIGLFGKSLGMHMFSIEMIDADAEEYPTIHQAAVSSSVFLLSLACGGAGFLTCLIDEDRRAIHDMVSNTLVVREI